MSWLKRWQRLLPDESRLSGWLLGMVLWMVLVTAGIGFASVSYWDWLSGQESGSAVVRNLILCAVALIGLPLAWWRSKVARGSAGDFRAQSAE